MKRRDVLKKGGTAIAAGAAMAVPNLASAKSKQHSGYVAMIMDGDHAGWTIGNYGYRIYPPGANVEIYTSIEEAEADIETRNKLNPIMDSGVDATKKVVPVYYQFSEA